MLFKKTDLIVIPFPKGEMTEQSLFADFLEVNIICSMNLN